MILFFCLFVHHNSVTWQQVCLLVHIQTDLWIFGAGESFVLIWFLDAWKDRWLSFELTGGRKAGGKGRGDSAPFSIRPVLSWPGDVMMVLNLDPFESSPARLRLTLLQQPKCSSTSCFDSSRAQPQAPPSFSPNHED